MGTIDNASGWQATYRVFGVEWEQPAAKDKALEVRTSKRGVCQPGFDCDATRRTMATIDLVKQLQNTIVTMLSTLVYFECAKEEEGAGGNFGVAPVVFVDEIFATWAFSNGKTVWGNTRDQHHLPSTKKYSKPYHFIIIMQWLQTYSWPVRCTSALALAVRILFILLLSMSESCSLTNRIPGT